MIGTKSHLCQGYSTSVPTRVGLYVTVHLRDGVLVHLSVGWVGTSMVLHLDDAEGIGWVRHSSRVERLRWHAVVVPRWTVPHLGVPPRGVAPFGSRQLAVS